MTEPADATHPAGKEGAAAAAEAGAPAAPRPDANTAPDGDDNTDADDPGPSGQRGESREERLSRRRAASAASSGKRVRKKKAPGGPTRPQGAYMQFLAQFRVQNAAELGGMQAADIGRRAGAAWRKMSDAEKETFKHKAEVDKVRSI